MFILAYLFAKFRSNTSRLCFSEASEVVGLERERSSQLLARSALSEWSRTTTN